MGDSSASSSASSSSASTWSDVLWRKYDEDETRLTAGVSFRMIELADLQPGMQVLDIATGRGEPAIRVAQFLGERGKVIGVDSSEAMLRMAQERADRENVSNLILHHLDAENLEALDEGPFDAVFARWGLMYMSQPVRSLRQAAQKTRLQGKLVAAFWAEEERVDYYSFPRKVLSKQLAIPAVDLNRPGTFYYADVQRIERDFHSSGWAIDTIMELYTPVMEAESEVKLIEWTRAFGLDRLLASESMDVRQRWEADMLQACQVWKNQGVFQLGGVTRLVLATRTNRACGVD